MATTRPDSCSKSIPCASSSSRAAPSGWARGDDDAPLHENGTPNHDYWIGESPVTVAQFRQFVEASGYAEHRPEALQDFDNRPLAWIPWYDALAFCRWLYAHWRARLPAGWELTLPSEAEWEKAARGGVDIARGAIRTSLADGFASPRCALQANAQAQRRYPWGDEWDAELANAEEDIGHTTTPGCFSRGRSPLGLARTWGRQRLGMDAQPLGIED
ncbi:MAG: SUMF1/EgtB/PvdO family nonheme iron enzyme [Candidatus Accumulibacter sp.]|uniref:SUMF1/EgtB/PvdO family nonheme iron enzyme n=1 Tax=Candidatus Accumulibacter proximus TaxID=2954385 RepID=A0A935Q139_9PROT|nr:SUMF1/EgtB/PvdO family nonheme iron enzyme [Candidatus Accumulibacter proximus]